MMIVVGFIRGHRQVYQMLKNIAAKMSEGGLMMLLIVLIVTFKSNSFGRFHIRLGSLAYMLRDAFIIDYNAYDS